MVRREEIRAMQDAWRAYLDLALGLTETSRKKATKVVKKLAGRGGATAEQLQSMAEELVSTSLANREALTRLVRYEAERALNRVGLATAEEVNALTSRVRELEQQLTEARAGQAAAAPATVRKVAKRSVAPRKAVPVDSTLVVPAPVTPAPPEVIAATEVAPEPVASAPAVKKVPAKKIAVKKAAGQPAPAKKGAVAKKTVAKKAPAKKAAGSA
jgi:polyhydroxyalkanoate synthesis regulator phasin